MRDGSLLSRLAPLVVLAAAVAVPSQIRAVAATRGMPAPGWPAAIVPTAVLATVVLLVAWIGTLAAVRVGLRAPGLDPSGGAPALPLLARQLGWGGLAGLLVALAALPFYYGVMRPLFAPEAFEMTETVRRAMGLPARIAMGGVLEEVVFRWAALAMIAWVGMKATGGVGPGVEWTSILGAALLFGLVHLPAAARLGVRMGPALVLAGLTMNGALGVVAGWLSWHRGLVAAMAAHATVHVAWVVVEAATG